MYETSACNTGVMKRFVNDERGQMTVELCVFLPVAIAIALIAVNAATFFESCAKFDRISRNAVRVHATSPTYVQSNTSSLSFVKSEIEDEFSASNLSCEVSVSRDFRGFDTYEMTLCFYPTLFGMGMRTEFFGIPVPPLKHVSKMTVCPYKPGMLF